MATPHGGAPHGPPATPAAGAAASPAGAPEIPGELRGLIATVGVIAGAIYFLRTRWRVLTGWLRLLWSDADLAWRYDGTSVAKWAIVVVMAVMALVHIALTYLNAKITEGTGWYVIAAEILGACGLSFAGRVKPVSLIEWEHHRNHDPDQGVAWLAGHGPGWLNPLRVVTFACALLVLVAVPYRFQVSDLLGDRSVEMTDIDPLHVMVWVYAGAVVTLFFYLPGLLIKWGGAPLVEFMRTAERVRRAIEAGLTYGAGIAEILAAEEAERHARHEEEVEVSDWVVAFIVRILFSVQLALLIVALIDVYTKDVKILLDVGGTLVFGLIAMWATVIVYDLINPTKRLQRMPTWLTKPIGFAWIAIGIVDLMLVFNIHVYAWVLGYREEAHIAAQANEDFWSCLWHMPTLAKLLFLLVYGIAISQGAKAAKAAADAVGTKNPYLKGLVIVAGGIIPAVIVTSFLTDVSHWSGALTFHVNQKFNVDAASVFLIPAVIALPVLWMTTSMKGWGYTEGGKNAVTLVTKYGFGLAGLLLVAGIGMGIFGNPPVASPGVTSPVSVEVASVTPPPVQRGSANCRRHREFANVVGQCCDRLVLVPDPTNPGHKMCFDVALP